LGVVPEVHFATCKSPFVPWLTQTAWSSLT
jgi:hypothetical protein